MVTYLTVEKVAPRITRGTRAQRLEISKCHGIGVYVVDEVVKTFAGGEKGV